LTLTMTMTMNEPTFLSKLTAVEKDELKEFILDTVNESLARKDHKIIVGVREAVQYDTLRLGRGYVR